MCLCVYVNLLRLQGSMPIVNILKWYIRGAVCVCVGGGGQTHTMNFCVEKVLLICVLNV